MGRLTGRTVLITGAAGGIGAASARRLVADGAKLVLADIDGAAVEKLAAELGQVALRVDVTVPRDIERMVDDDTAEAINITYQNASIAIQTPVPAAVWLFGSAIGLIGVMRRKAV